jgi:hypothetical protein
MRQKGLKNYLEIGVFNGHIFFRIQSRFKVAVDPAFQFGSGRKAGKLLLNPYNLYNRYFEKTSDDFFASDAPNLFAEKKIELALIDGMHEFDFALRDVENTLRYSAEDAVLLLHDCNPITKEGACSFREWEERGFSGVWNGDVWKVLLYLRSLRKDLTSFVLDTDHGLGVVVKQKNPQPLPYTKEAIERFTYADFDAHRQEWLGLRPPDYFYEFFGLKGR